MDHKNYSNSRQIVTGSWTKMPWSNGKKTGEAGSIYSHLEMPANSFWAMCVIDIN